MSEMSESEENAKMRQWILEVLTDEGPTKQQRLGFRVGSYSSEALLVADEMADEGLIQRFKVEKSPHVWFAKEEDDAQPLPTYDIWQQREDLYDLLLKAAAKYEYYDRQKQLLWLAAQIVERTSEDDIKDLLSVQEGCRPAQGFLAGRNWEQRRGIDPEGLNARVAKRREQELPAPTDN